MMADEKKCNYCNKLDHNAFLQTSSTPCLGSVFHSSNKYEVDYLDENIIKSTPLEQLINYSFRSVIEESGESEGYLWWTSKLYNSFIYIIDENGKEKKVRFPYSIIGKKKEDAVSAIEEMTNMILQRQALGQKKLDQKNCDAIINSKPDPSKTPNLTKKDPSQIDPAKAIDEIDDLTNENNKNINSLKVSPEENAAAIARLKRIQEELAKRKRLMQEFEKSKIFEQIKNQQHELEITNQLIEQKAQEFKKAEAEGDITKAKRLNAEYLELKRKQGAVLAFMENLNQNASFTTFTKFTSLDELYNPDHSLVSDIQIKVEELQPTNWDKAKPYVWGGVIVVSLLLLIYYAYKWLVK